MPGDVLHGDLMQFVPLWTAILRSRKVAGLPDDLFRTWTLCLLTAQEHDHKHGSLPPVDDFSYSIHMEAKSLMSRLSRLVTLRFLDIRDGVYYIHDWDDWKHRPDPTGAARKRAQRERERQKELEAQEDNDRNGEYHESENVTVTPVTSRDVTKVTMSHTNSTNEEEEDARANGEPDELVAFGRQAFGSKFDDLCLGQKLSGWRAARYPDAWIKDAMLCANCSAKGNIAAYINKTLISWHARGGPNPADLLKAQIAQRPVEYFTGNKAFLHPPGTSR